MKTFLGRLSAGAVASAALLGAGTASADAPGDAALGRLDKAMNQATSMYVEYEITNQEPGKAEQKIAINVYSKGEKRLLDFTAPADLKGTKVLILSPTEMYVYLPSFGKVRRIASHTTDQGFMGMAFSPNDFASPTYSPMWTAKMLGDGPSEAKIEATPKPGQSVPYGKLEFTVAKDKDLPTEIKYFNAAGALVRTESRSGYTCEAKVCTPTTLTLVDHAKGGHSTKATRKRRKVNEPISDDVFSKRNLER
jgi:outer membrane lipoprotein-sorting protein